MTYVLLPDFTRWIDYLAYSAIPAPPLAMGFTGPVALSTQVFVSVNRSQVNLTLKGVFGISTVNTVFTSTAPLPTGTYRTDRELLFTIPIIDNSTPVATGSLRITTGGIVILAKNVALDGYTAAGNAGWNNISVAYSL